MWPDPVTRIYEFCLSSVDETLRPFKRERERLGLLILGGLTLLRKRKANLRILNGHVYPGMINVVAVIITFAKIKFSSLWG